MNFVEFRKHANNILTYIYLYDICKSLLLRLNSLLEKVIKEIFTSIKLI